MGEPERVPRAAAVGAQSRPVLPLTPLPTPAVRRASSPSFCRVPLQSSTLPSHSLLLPPPHRSTPPGLSPSPSALPSLQSSDLNLVLSRFLSYRPPPAHAALLPGRTRTRPAARPGVGGLRGPGGRRSGPAIASPRGAAWGKGSEAATSVLPTLPAGSRCGAERAARPWPLPRECGWSLRPQPSVRSSLCFPQSQDKKG